MSILHINRLKSLLESKVFPFIDVEKIKEEKPNISESQLESLCLSQAYLLYILRNLTNLDYKLLSGAIVDNFKDNGIDAILYSTQDNTLYLCQSKFNKKGQSTIDTGEVLKFLEGVNDILSLRFEKFNTRVQALKEKIEKAIYSPAVQIKLLIGHTGNKLHDDINELINEKIDSLNDTSEVIFFEEYSLVKAYNDLMESASGEAINVDVDLLNWGINEEPYKSYYGKISCGAIAELAQGNSQRLYSKNLRSFIGLSSINYDIVKSILEAPEHFFYLNNGIVLLCKSINKYPFNTGNRDIGKFQLIDVSIINGAQTVGAIKYAFNKQPEKVNNANVFIKIISLDKTPENFEKYITVASNTQNKIEKRDFISLDKEQLRLIEDFFILDLTYHVKRDDVKEKYDANNFYFEEATVSLASFQDNEDLSTYAKREIGKLWEDDNYNKLFNSTVNARFLANIILVYRAIDNYIKTIQDPVSRGICSHGIYLLTNIFFGKHKSRLKNPNIDLENFLDEHFKNDIVDICQKTVQYYNTNFTQNKIPLSVFKNFNYCRDIKKSVLGTSKMQPTLFDSFY